MKILRLYSKTGLFNEILFQDGINIIEGRHTQQRNNPSTNGVGKSSVIRMIDFCLLSSINHNDSVFRNAKYDYLREENHSATLEFGVKNNVYEITRSFKNIDLIGFSERNIESELSVERAKVKLFGLLFNNDLYDGEISHKDFRNLIKFYIKDDSQSSSRKSPQQILLNNSTGMANIRILFYLIDIANNLISEFISEKEILKLLTSEIFRIKKSIESDGTKISDIRHSIAEYKSQVDNLQKAVSEFNFFGRYDNIELQIKQINISIQENLENLEESYSRIQTIENRIQFVPQIDIQAVSLLYETINKELAQFIKKTYEEVIQFNMAISESRRKFLNDRKNILLKQVDRIKDNLKNLNDARQDLLVSLEEDQALDPIQKTYKEMAIAQSKYEILESKIKDYTIKKAAASRVEEELQSIITRIIMLVEGEQTKKIEYEIRKGLRSIFSFVYNQNDADKVVFEVDSNSSRDVPVKIECEFPRNESGGYFQFKFAAFDLVLLFNQKHRALPKFLVHDGLYPSIDSKSKARLLNYVENYLTNNNYPFQYIITDNEGEIDKNEIKFNYNSKVIASFQDIASKMFFKKELD